MVGIIKNASGRTAIQNVFSGLMSGLVIRGDWAVGLEHRTKRIAAIMISAAIVAGCASFPALGRGRGAAPEPAPGLAPEVVNKAEQRLSEIGYWFGPIGDKSAERTRYAILAFQRVSGLSQTGRLDAAGIEAMSVATRPVPLETGYTHIEVDLQRQVLFVVDEKIGVTLVLPISSGSGKLYTFEGKTSRAVTPRGRFTVYRKVKGWRKAPLGMIYYPNYFDEGWAIHGSASVPNYPASHGCVRIPIITAKELSDVTPVGTVVLVYDGREEAATIRPRS